MLVNSNILLGYLAKIMKEADKQLEKHRAVTSKLPVMDHRLLLLNKDGDLLRLSEISSDQHIGISENNMHAAMKHLIA